MSNSYKDFFDVAQKQTRMVKNKVNISQSKFKDDNPNSDFYIEGDYLKNTITGNEIKNETRSEKMKTRLTKKEIAQKKVILKNKKNKGLIFFISIGFLLTSLGGVFVDDVLKYIKLVDISFYSTAGAVESKKEDTASDKKDGVQDDTPEKKKLTENTSTSETKRDLESDEIELNHLARLKERKIELDKREEELIKLEEALTQQKNDLDQKLKELENIRRNISSTLEEKVQNDDQKVLDLVAFYSNMKPPQAAKIIETIDEALAVRIIEKMKKKNAADIMNLLKPEKAQALSEKYAGYRK